MGLETTSLPHRLYRLTCAFRCVGSTCLCAFDVDFSLVRTWTCIGVVHIDAGSSSVVRDAHSNFDSSTDNQLTTSNGNNRPEKHPLSMHEEVCDNESRICFVRKIVLY